MEKFRKHTRHKKHNYDEQGDYFITICSHQFSHIFSSIKNGHLHLSPIGGLIEYSWKKLPEKFPTVKLGASIIMPNHFHGIISLKLRHDIRFCSKPITLGSIVRQFKSTTTRLVKENISSWPKNKSIWQCNYYDQILNDEYHYYFVEEYIQDNPKNWHKDKLFKKTNHINP